MAFHNVPPNGFPDIPDIEDLEAVQGDVTVLKSDVSELKSGLTNYENQNNTNLEVPNRKNLFNKDDASILTGQALNPETGIVYPSASWSTSNFIKIEPSTTYTLTAIQSVTNSVAFYDSEKTYISGESTFGTRTTPSNAKYLRFDYKTENVAVIQLELGTTETAYTAYIPSVESRLETVSGAINELDNDISTLGNKVVLSGNAESIRAWTNDSFAVISVYGQTNYFTVQIAADGTVTGSVAPLNP